MTPADITYQAPVWRVTTAETPVPVAAWGKDHWSTLAYVETRTVDHKGLLDHDHMRCSPGLHPMLHGVGRRKSHSAMPPTEYATRVKGQRTYDSSGRPTSAWRYAEHRPAPSPGASS